MIDYGFKIQFHDFYLKRNETRKKQIVTYRIIIYFIQNSEAMDASTTADCTVFGMTTDYPRHLGQIMRVTNL